MFTLDKVRESVARQVEKNGEDFMYTDHYSQSRYGTVLVEDNIETYPSCIVGHIMADLDRKTFEDVVFLEGTNTMSIRELHMEGIIKLPEGGEGGTVLGFLEVLQDEQDCGATWGEALEAANKFLEEEGAL